MWEFGFDLSGSYYSPVKGSCEHGNEISDSIIDQLNDYQLLNKDFALLIYFVRRITWTCKSRNEINLSSNDGNRFLCILAKEHDQTGKM
jgi:hypothetical protein